MKESEEPDCLYHYCSNDAFVSIVRNCSMRLSALSLSNDTEEGRLIRATVMRLAERDKLNSTARNTIQSLLVFIESSREGLGFCLSEEKDLLSQWRGYAANASGVAIGFNRAYLEKYAEDSLKRSVPESFDLLKVKYEVSEHEAAIHPTYEELRKMAESPDLDLSKSRLAILGDRLPTEDEMDEEMNPFQKAIQTLFDKLWELAPLLHQLKSQAFREEKEWRLVSPYGWGIDRSLEFFARGEAIVPYRDLPISENGIKPILRVVIGPRNVTPPNIIKSFLAKNFGQVEINRSKASYR